MRASVKLELRETTFGGGRDGVDSLPFMVFGVGGVARGVEILCASGKKRVGRVSGWSGRMVGRLRERAPGAGRGKGGGIGAVYM